MDKYSIYNDIAIRTGGDIFIGVVGPVRCGKSTFISKFLETLVLPNIESKLQKSIATDEMPQSADGKTIMTTEPKFIPANGVKVKFSNKTSANIRLVDCVGYIVDEAVGHSEGEKERLVKTPWSEEKIPFSNAAELGTKKVIDDYSTIAVMITTDGSFGELKREDYEVAEEKCIMELKNHNRPFVIVLNSAKPNSSECLSLSMSLEEKYNVPVVAKDILNIDEKGISDVMEKVFMEFPMQSFNINLPKWMQALNSDSEIISVLTDKIKNVALDMSKMKDYYKICDTFSDDDNFKKAELKEINMGNGVAEYSMTAKEELFYKVLSNECEEKIDDEFSLMTYIKSFSMDKKEFSKIQEALKEADENGYGVVLPTVNEMNLEEPILVRHGKKYGVKLKASAPSLHIMKVDVSTEVSPMVGSEAQGEEMVNSLMDKFKDNPQGLWETEMLGKSLHDLVNEGMNNKLFSMPKDTQSKMRRTLGRIVNERRGGIICILL